MAELPIGGDSTVIDQYLKVVSGEADTGAVVPCAVDHLTIENQISIQRGWAANAVLSPSANRTRLADKESTKPGAYNIGSPSIIIRAQATQLCNK
nr:hypothetical protein [Pseudomonas sp. BIGb0427]